jgi:GT2 family glycosyltransferase
MDIHEKSDVSISVVVCTRNRAEKLANCLAHLADQTLDPSCYEILVVDDWSTDNTAEVLERFPVRAIQNELKAGYAAARNLGVRATEASVIAFTDDDCVPDRRWLEELLRALEDPDVLAVGGRIDPLRADRLLLRYYAANNPLAHNAYVPTPTDRGLGRLRAYLRASFRLRAPESEDVPLFAITSANMAIRRSSFELLGGFDERYVLPGGEDEDLCLRLHRARPGALLRYSSQAVVAHDYDPRFRDAFRRARAYGAASAIGYLTRGDRLPAIFPFPILILLSFAAATVNLALLVIPVVLILLLYPGWLRLAVSRRAPAYLGFAVLQAALELQTSIGFVRRLITERRLLPRRASEAS